MHDKNVELMLRRLDRLVGATIPQEIREQAHRLVLVEGWKIGRLEKWMRRWIGEKLGVWHHVHRSRETGAEILVVSPPHAMADGDEPFTTVCATHGSTICHASLTAAREWAGQPWAWCEECRAIVEQAKAANSA